MRKRLLNINFDFLSLIKARREKGKNSMITEIKKKHYQQIQIEIPSSLTKTAIRTVKAMIVNEPWFAPAAKISIRKSDGKMLIEFRSIGLKHKEDIETRLLERIMHLNQ